MDKESTRLSQVVTSIWVSTEVDYTALIDDKTTKEKFQFMGNLKKRRYCKKGGEMYRKIQIKV